jgi:oxygen-independent coproporphyrinogen-3 oxidase
VKKRLGQIKAVEDTLELRMLHDARKRLHEAGYQAYEISNYALPGRECRHNLIYWHGEDYIGLGPSAASHVRGTRWKNRPHLGEWEQAIDSGKLPAAEVETLTPEQRAGELAMLMLRLAEGLKYSAFAAKTGFDARIVYEPQIRQLHRCGLLEVDEGGFRLSERGLDVADSIAAQFVAAPA